MKKLIIMFNVLTITSFMTPLTIACNNKADAKQINITKELDLSKITADMIINWKSEYKIINKQGVQTTVKAEKLGSIDDHSKVASIFSTNLIELFASKLTGIDKAKIHGIPLNDMSNWTEAEIKNYSNFTLLIMDGEEIKIDIKAAEQDSKIFTAIIEIKDWNIANEDNKIEKRISSMQEENQKLLKLSDEEKKEHILQNRRGTTSTDIEKDLKMFVRYLNAMQQVNLASVKSIYDSIKGTSANIIIDLTSKQ